MNRATTAISPADTAFNLGHFIAGRQVAGASGREGASGPAASTDESPSRTGDCITGFNPFVIDEEDPLKFGFAL